MKEPRDTGIFAPLQCNESYAETWSVESPLHRSTPKSQQVEECRDRRKNSMVRYLEETLSQRDGQLSTMLKAYESLLLSLPQQNEAIDDLDESGECVIGEAVVELVQGLASQLLLSQQEVNSLKSTNDHLERRFSQMEHERTLLAEVEGWRESCNEARKEIEDLKRRLAGQEIEIKKLINEKQQLQCKVKKLKTNLAENACKNEDAIHFAQHHNLKHEVNTLKRLVDEQQKVIGVLQVGLRDSPYRSSGPSRDFRQSTNRRNLDDSFASSLSSWPVSTVNSESSARLSSLGFEESLTRMDHRPLSSSSLHHDESLVKLGHLLATSEEVLRMMKEPSTTDSNRRT